MPCEQLFYFHVIVPHVHSAHRGQQKTLDPSRTGVTDNFELPCDRWEKNLGPLQELQVLLTTELYLLPKMFIFLKNMAIYMCSD